MRRPQLLSYSAGLVILMAINYFNGCNEESITPFATQTPTFTMTPTATPTSTATPLPTATATPQNTPTATPTPNNCYFKRFTIKIGPNYYFDPYHLYTVKIGTRIKVWFTITYTYDFGNFWKAWYQTDTVEYEFIAAGTGNFDQMISFIAAEVGFMSVHIEGYSGEDTGNVGCEAILNFLVEK